MATSSDGDVSNFIDTILASYTPPEEIASREASRSFIQSLEIERTRITSGQTGSTDHHLPGRNIINAMSNEAYYTTSVLGRLAEILQENRQEKWPDRELETAVLHYAQLLNRRAEEAFVLNATHNSGLVTSGVMEFVQSRHHDAMEEIVGRPVTKLMPGGISGRLSQLIPRMERDMLNISVEGDNIGILAHETYLETIRDIITLNRNTPPPDQKVEEVATRYARALNNSILAGIGTHQEQQTELYQGNPQYGRQGLFESVTDIDETLQRPEIANSDLGNALRAAAQWRIERIREGTFGPQPVGELGLLEGSVLLSINQTRERCMDQIFPEPETGQSRGPTRPPRSL